MSNLTLHHDSPEDRLAASVAKLYPTRSNRRPGQRRTGFLNLEP